MHAGTEGCCRRGRPPEKQQPDIGCTISILCPRQIRLCVQAAILEVSFLCLPSWLPEPGSGTSSDQACMPSCSILQETPESEDIVSQDFGVESLVSLQPHNGEHLRCVSFQQPVAEPFSLEHPLRQPVRSSSFSTTASIESLEEDLRHDLVVSSSIGQCSTIGPCSTGGPCSASSSRRQSILSDSGRASRGCSVMFDTPPCTGDVSPAGIRQASWVTGKEDAQLNVVCAATNTSCSRCAGLPFSKRHTVVDAYSVVQVVE